MIGHIHQGFMLFIKETFGEDVWTEACAKTNMSLQIFLQHQEYRDDIMNKLLEAVRQIVGISGDRLLEDYGCFLISQYWDRSGHIGLLQVLGRDMHTFLNNLDTLHNHLSSTHITKLSTPSFRSEKNSIGLLLHYISSRKGLVLLVKGILIEIAKHLFQLKIDVSVEEHEEMVSSSHFQHHYVLGINIHGEIDEDKLMRLQGKNKNGGKTFSAPTSKLALFSTKDNCPMSSLTPNKPNSTHPLHHSPMHLPTPRTSLVPTDSTTQLVDPASWPISMELFGDTISPFHIIFDSSLVIQTVGRSMAKMLPNLVCGAHKMSDCFKLDIPVISCTYQNIRTHSNHLFILVAFNENIILPSYRRQKLPRFRGQMFAVSNSPDSPILFLASPSTVDYTELHSMGFSIIDIPMHDVLNEVLETYIYFKQELNLSDELEKTKEQLKSEKKRLQQEKSRTDILLQAMLPKQVALELQHDGYINPLELSNVSVLMTSLENFQRLCRVCTPLDVVKVLNHLFGNFDHIVEKKKVYKVETTGDCYMVAAGLPDTETEFHAKELTDVALQMMEIIHANPLRLGGGSVIVKPQLVIGIHSGPVVAGVVGSKLPRYCLFGDTVNTASRMNSTGLVGKIHISEPTYKLIKDDLTYQFISRGNIYVKGLGLRATYFVTHQVHMLVYGQKAFASPSSFSKKQPPKLAWSSGSECDTINVQQGSAIIEESISQIDLSNTQPLVSPVKIDGELQAQQELQDKPEMVVTKQEVTFKQQSQDGVEFEQDIVLPGEVRPTASTGISQRKCSTFTIIDGRTCSAAQDEEVKVSMETNTPRQRGHGREVAVEHAEKTIQTELFLEKHRKVRRCIIA